MAVKKEQFDMAVWAKLYQQTYKAASEDSGASRNLKIECIKKKVRDYLDKCGLKLQPGKFPYDPRNKLTWKYLENNKTNNPNKDNNDYSPTIINKKCIYYGMDGF